MTVATDQQGHHHIIGEANALMNESIIESSFENVGMVYNNHFIGSGEKCLCRVYFGETAPGTDYATVVKGGDEYFMYTFSSNLVTTKHHYVYQLGVWRKYLTDYIPIVDSIAITAEAGSAWHGMRIKSRSAAQTITGEHTGLYIETEATGASVSGNHSGIKVETYVTSTATIGDHYGIAVYTYDDIAGTNNSLNVIRLEHNGAAVGGAFIECQCAAGKMQYLLQSSTTDDTWMSITTTPTCATAAGWERVKYGGYVRYRQLYSAVS
jgi:hypothetical protein